MTSKISEQIARDALLRSEDLRAYTRAAWNIIEPGNQLLWGTHHSLISEHLTCVKSGEIRRLIINIPPRNMKSILTSVSFPTWVWTTDPGHRFMCVSYAATLATKHSIDRRTILESNWYKNRWGHKFALADDQNVKSKFLNDKMGHMIATSTQGVATGEGADTLIVDDIHNVKRSDSDTMREADIRAFDQTFVSRLNDKKSGRIIVIMQRLHERDLTGHLLAKGGWVHLKIPAIAEKKLIYIFPISKKEYVREPGDIMHPEREDKAVLNELKREQGSATFAGQYQQEPAPTEGNIIKRSWIKFYLELPSRIDASVQSWDMSFKGSASSDFVVGGVWSRAKGDYFLIDRIKDKMDFPSTIKAVIAFSAKHKRAYRKLVEDKANGSGVIDSLQHEVGGFIRVNPDTSKIARLNSVAPMFEAGNVYLPHPSIAPWVNDYIEELVTFPGSQNDDQVDMTSQALNDLRIGHSDLVLTTGQNNRSTIVPSKRETSW